MWLQPTMRDVYHCGSYGITICAQLTDDHDNGKRRSEERILVGPGYPTAERLIFTLPDGAVVTLKGSQGAPVTSCHIGVGQSDKRTKVVLFVAGKDVQVVDDKHRLIRALRLDPTKKYQPQK